MTQSTIPADVRERIVAAAVDLYEQAGRERFPTVDAVRRLSRADMNAVSGVMKEWRQAQTTQAAPVAIAVPEAVQQANAAAVAALWLNATELANQSLRSAQTAWDKERGELDDMRAELANSFEVQAVEFETTKKQLADSEAKTAEQAQELDAVRQREAEAVNRAEVAQARISEIEHRAADLRGELDRALAETERQRVELAAARAKAAVEIADAQAATQAARAELVKVQAKADAREEAHIEQGKQAAAEINRTAERMTKTEAERDTARKEAGEAREAAAKLAGKLEAVNSQNAELLALIKPPIEKVKK
jgi:colicin import membrane protein